MPEFAPTAIVLDTNVVLGWLVFGEPWSVALQRSLAEGRCRWLACPAMVLELEHVLERALPARWESSRQHALTLPWREWMSIVATEAQRPAAGLICRDRGDQKFVDLALAHGAHWLLSFDRDLLALRRRAATRGLAIGPPTQWTAHLRA